MRVRCSPAPSSSILPMRAAYAGVADCSSFLYMYIEATQENLREAANASRRAVELDPESAEAHASRGLAESLSQNYQEAEKEFEEAIRLNPRLYEAFYFYGRSCFAQGNMEKAAELFRKAARTRSRRLSIHRATGKLSPRAWDAWKRRARRAKRAFRVIARYIELHPEIPALYISAPAPASRRRS